MYVCRLSVSYLAFLFTQTHTPSQPAVRAGLYIPSLNIEARNPIVIASLESMIVPYATSSCADSCAAACTGRSGFGCLSDKRGFWTAIHSLLSSVGDSSRSDLGGGR